MDATAPAIFPDAGISGQRRSRGTRAERLKQLKQTVAAGARQAAIEEHRHGGKNDAAIDVILHLRDGGIADAHGPVIAIALQIRRYPLIEIVGRNDAIDGLQVLLVVGRDGEREIDEVFHRLCRTDAVERLDDEIGIAQPAIPIVPGPAGAG